MCQTREDTSSSVDILYDIQHIKVRGVESIPTPPTATHSAGAVEQTDCITTKR